MNPFCRNERCRFQVGERADQNNFRVGFHDFPGLGHHIQNGSVEGRAQAELVKRGALQFQLSKLTGLVLLGDQKIGLGDGKVLFGCFNLPNLSRTTFARAFHKPQPGDRLFNHFGRAFLPTFGLGHDAGQIHAGPLNLRIDLGNHLACDHGLTNRG